MIMMLKKVRMTSIGVLVEMHVLDHCCSLNTPLTGIILGLLLLLN